VQDDFVADHIVAKAIVAETQAKLPLAGGHADQLANVRPAIQG